MRINNPELEQLLFDCCDIQLNTPLGWLTAAILRASAVKTYALNPKIERSNGPLVDLTLEETRAVAAALKLRLSPEQLEEFERWELEHGEERAAAYKVA
jgi:hypothetical protein